jgi:multiple sugar transport system permease protein
MSVQSNTTRTMGEQQKSTAQEPHRRKRSVSSLQRREAMYGLLFASPYLIGFVLWVGGPVVASLVLSFFRYDILSMQWVGFANYIYAFTADPQFFPSYWRTLYFVVLSVPLGVLSSLLLAWLLDQKLRGVSIFRALFFAPSLTPVTALALLWGWIFNTNFGVLNHLISGLTDLEGPNWGSPQWAMPVIVIAGTWAAAGGTSMLIFLAALQGVPQALYDAADIDGAGAWRRFRHVTIPMISPTIFFITVLSIIGAVRAFDLIFNLSSSAAGGPAYSRYVMALHIYNTAFRYNEMGYACALSWIFLLVILVVTLVQFVLQKRWVFYVGASD